MMHKLIDTNILFDAWADNVNTQNALEVINEPIFIIEGVLYELANLLKNTKGTGYACKVLNNILDNPEIFHILSADKEEQQYALQIMEKYETQTPKKDYSLVDSLQFVLAQKYRLDIYTLDERMSYFDNNKIKIIKPY
jgi:predicted nucleic acid-binding protein